MRNPLIAQKYIYFGQPAPSALCIFRQCNVATCRWTTEIRARRFLTLLAPFFGDYIGIAGRHFVISKELIVDKVAVLNGWKEIASYLKFGVRTVQRYERTLSLPIRRPAGKHRSSVFAITHELDSWLRNAPKRVLLAQQLDAAAARPKQLPYATPHQEGEESQKTQFAAVAKIA